MRRAVLSLLLSTIVVIAVPATAGAVAPGAESERVEHVTTLPAPAGIGANFKKYEDGSTYMFVTGTSGLWVYDVTDADDPALTGTLPLPHYQNEDVSIGGNRLLLSGDGYLGGSILHVVDISDPSTPRLERTIKMYLLGGPGHTATCIQDCKYVWVAGGDSVYVLNLDEADAIPSNGVLPGIQDQSLGKSNVEVGDTEIHREFGWGTHDVQVDKAGYAWVVGGNGTAAFDVRPEAYPVPGKPYPDNLLEPTLVARTGPDALNDGDFGIEDANQGAPGTNEDTVNDFIHHNSWRPNATKFDSRSDAELASPDVERGELVLISEEDIWHRPDGAAPGGCETQGSFQTWQVKQFGSPDENTSTVKNLDSWTTEFNDALGDADGEPQDGDLVPTKGMCSSHYFDERKNIVASAWYEQGVRFLDVSNPKDIKQVGYFMGPGAATWAAYWSPTDNDVVYVVDNNRGLDVLRFNRASLAKAKKQGRRTGVRAPLTPPKARSKRVGFAKPHPKFGFVCRLGRL